MYVGHTCFDCKSRVALLALLMRSSPNLKKLKIEVNLHSVSYLNKFVCQTTLHNSYCSFFQITFCFKSDPETCSFKLKDCSDIWLEHLNEFEIINLSTDRDQLDFVKLILAKSPVLKKVNIFTPKGDNKNQKWHIPRILLASPRASPTVSIITEHASV